MDAAALLDSLNASERATLNALTLHEWLTRDGRPDQARLAQVIYMDASSAQENLERILEDE
jgi:hypothetical protein